MTSDKADEPSARERVAVVAVTYHSDEVLPTFLDSLAKATARPLDIVLVDNGGGARAELDRDWVRTVGSGGNPGYGGGANIGVAATSAEWVVVANPDIVWTPGALDALLAAAERWPRAGSLGPRVDTVDGSIYPSARELPSLGRGAGHALFGWWWPSNPWTAAYRRERGEPVEGAAGWLSGSCLLLRRNAFDAIGGFDPSYFMYFEDVDLGARLGAAGWQNVYVPTARVVHTGGHSTSKDPGRMAVEHHRSAYRYLARRYPGPLWWPVRAIIKVALMLRAVLARQVRSVAEGAAPQRHSD